MVATVGPVSTAIPNASGLETPSGGQSLWETHSHTGKTGQQSHSLDNPQLSGRWGGSNWMIITPSSLF